MAAAARRRPLVPLFAVPDDDARLSRPRSSVPSLCVRHAVLSRAVVAVPVLAVASVLGWWLGLQRQDASPRARVVEVIDGDTIVVAFADGSTDTIRLLGINTPETC